MSIPLDRLYHYILDIVKQVYNDDVVIYRFYPYGSKNIEDLKYLLDYSQSFRRLSAEIICYDQEPLNYDNYQYKDAKVNIIHKELYDIEPTIFKSFNLRYLGYLNIYDKCLLIHSEKNSVEVEKYKNNHFIPVYYWSHGLIAQDWFRYAKYVNIQPSEKPQQFLIYNRAWAGTREYRFKFVELLQENDLVNYCKTSFNPVDPEHGIHYTDHEFKNPAFRPTKIENSFPTTVASAHSSADFDINDYANTKFEVVLETLFDDSRVHLTEKTLRPIACGHPFILAATPGSLAYLRDYGFKTFDGIIDESYDLETNPVKRLELIIAIMASITKWTEAEQKHNWNKINKITAYNKQHFFGEQFKNRIVDELTENLKTAFDELENTNTSKSFLDYRKACKMLPFFKIPSNRKNLSEATLRKARGYYRRYLKSRRDH